MTPPFHAQDFLDLWQLQAIGTITVNWSLIEATVSVGIWQMLGVRRPVGLSITADLGATARIDMFRSVGSIVFEGNKSVAEEIDSVHTALKEMNTMRNNLVHLHWSVGANDPQALRTKKISTRGGILKEATVRMTNEELLQTVSASGALLDRVDSLVVSHFPAPL